MQTLLREITGRPKILKQKFVEINKAFQQHVEMAKDLKKFEQYHKHYLQSFSFLEKINVVHEHMTESQKHDEEVKTLMSEFNTEYHDLGYFLTDEMLNMKSIKDDQEVEEEDTRNIKRENFIHDFNLIKPINELQPMDDRILKKYSKMYLGKTKSTTLFDKDKRFLKIITLNAMDYELQKDKEEIDFHFSPLQSTLKSAAKERIKEIAPATDNENEKPSSSARLM